MVIVAFIEPQMKERAPQTVKQQVVGIRMLFDWMVIGQVRPHHPIRDATAYDIDREE